MISLSLFRAQQSLIEACHEVIKAQLMPPQITFSGLSHFNDKVLFMDPVKDVQLETLTRIAGIGFLFVFLHAYTSSYSEIYRDTFEKSGIS